jgi:tryptophan 2,3-dioxygenase
MRQAGWAMPARHESAEDPNIANQATLYLRDMYLSGSNPDLRDVSEELATFDSLILLWRTHHAVMAERAIGSKVGTGGEGVRYLYETARMRCFPELNTMRSQI